MDDDKKILVVCEESEVVRDAFTRAGWDAWSVDLKPSRTPGQHYHGNLFDILGCGWNLVIAHPPCTAIAVSGNRYYAGTQARMDGIKFVERIWFFDGYTGPLCIENPVGVLTTQSRLPVKPQYIQPYDFGENASKKTGLWLRNLPRLRKTKYINPRMVGSKPRWDNQTDGGQNKLPPSETRAAERAVTYLGIAEAMAQQWGNYGQR